MREILTIQVNDYDSFDDVFNALDQCGSDNNFGFLIMENEIIAIKVEKIIDLEFQKQEVVNALDNCGYENNFSFEIL